MDFENIEGLNEEQILNLYDNIVESGTFISVVQTPYCYCADRYYGEQVCRYPDGRELHALVGCK